MVVVTHERYTPVGAQPGSLIKASAPPDAPQATDLYNSEMQAIANALVSISSLGAPVSVNTVLTNASRNVLVDLSSLVNTDAGIVVTLPGSPSVGDPPCFVMVQKPGYHTAAAHKEAVVIVTSTDAQIDGVNQDNATYTTQTPLFNAGDLAVAIYVGGDLGWHISYVRTVVANPSADLTAPALGTFPCAGLEIYGGSGTLAFAPTTPTFRAGDRFAVMTGTGTVQIGDATYTFNGVAGPYVVPASYKRREFRCVDTLTFAVASS